MEFTFKKNSFFTSVEFERSIGAVLIMNVEQGKGKGIRNIILNAQ